MKAVLGLDLGTQSTKAALVAFDGTPLDACAESVDFERPRPSWGEQPARTLVTSALACIATLTARCRGIDIAGVGIAAQMGGAIGIDRAFSPITPHEMWLDTRADADREELLALYGPEILAKNGIIPFVAPRVRRWRRLDPSGADRIAKVVAPAGYLAGHLTGATAERAVCDRTQANLFGCFDVAGNAWDLDLSERCGLPARLLPRIADPFDVVGGLTADIAAMCGLRAGTPVTAGMGDGTAGWLAAGGTEPGICVDTSGSSSHFAVTVGRFVTDPDGLLSCMPSAVAGRFYLLGFTTSTGLAHRWLCETLGRSHAELGALAASSPPGARGVMAVPHFNGRVSPFEASIKGCFLGFDDKSGPGDLYRALLEASAFELDGWLSAARRLAPEVTLSTVVNVGGGARNPVWNQIKADVTGLTFRAAAPEVNAARGAALAAGVAIGAVDPVRNGWFAPGFFDSAVATPDPSGHEAYAPYRDSYATMAEHLLPIYRIMQRLRQNEPTGGQGDD